MMHRGTEQILIRCENVKTINDTIRKIHGVKWSQTHNSWYLPLNKEIIIVFIRRYIILAIQQF